VEWLVFLLRLRSIRCSALGNVSFTFVTFAAGSASTSTAAPPFGLLFCWPAFFAPRRKRLRFVVAGNTVRSRRTLVG
jgi:hypothetical protein